MTNVAFTTWFKDIIPLTFKDDILTISVMNDLISSTLERRYKSRFLPEYTDALLYYDTTYFAKRIFCPALEGVTGLGDTCAIPSATMSYFNALASSQKVITFQQNGVHGGHGRFYQNFTVEK